MENHICLITSTGPQYILVFACSTLFFLQPTTYMCYSTVKAASICIEQEEVINPSFTVDQPVIPKHTREATQNTSYL